MPQTLLKIITVFLINSYVILSLARTYYSDPCITKTQQGICKTWLQCPYIETLIKRGEYTVEEVVHCGFEGTGSNGEIICCPLNKSLTRSPPDVTDRPAIVETSTSAVETKLWPDMLITTTTTIPHTSETPALLKTNPNAKAPAIHATENVTEKPSTMEDNQCFNCNSPIRNSTDVNEIQISHENGQDKVRDKYKTNESKKQQLQQLISNVFQININREIDSTTELNPGNPFNATTIRPDVNESKQTASDVINLGPDNFQFDNFQKPDFTKQFRTPNLNPTATPVPQQQPTHLLQQNNGNQLFSLKLPQAATVQQQQFTQNTQLLDQYNMGQPINQYQISPPLQPPFQQIQNFQFQLPPPSRQLLNELIPLIQLQTLSRNEFGQLQVTPGHINQISLNGGQYISQAELEYYTRLLLQMQEQQKVNIFDSLNQIPQSNNYDNLKMIPLQQIPQNHLQNPYAVWPQSPLQQQPLPANNIMLNQMSFNPQMPSNAQSSSIAPIPNNMLSQMQFHPSTSQKLITEVASAATKPATTIDGTFNAIGVPHIQHLQMPMQQQQQQQQLYNKKNLIPNNTIISPIENNPIKTDPSINEPLGDPNRVPKNYDSNLSNPTSNHSHLDNIWNVIKKEETQSPSRQSKKLAKMILLPHIANSDDKSRPESPITERSTSTTARTTAVNDMRPAVQACNILEGGLFKYITPHILGGVPSEWGEFPHMAAIGYSRIGEDGPPYDIKCGGTLISSRFILTAAHCVSRRNVRPKVVRLGVVNFNDPEQMEFLVELRIKRHIIHDNYNLGSSYNDIALLELENQVIFTQYIYPTCLYTNTNDPLQTDILYVTGWGVVNLTTRAYSDILLKAPLKITPLEECDKQLREYGLPRQLDRGVLKSLMCAGDKNQEKDACQGDSGGPLNLQIDESTRNYRIVGIVISGFECASSTPGLYIRVAEYLNFIEKHVWPDEQYDNEVVQQFLNGFNVKSKSKSSTRINDNSITKI